MAWRCMVCGREWEEKNGVLVKTDAEKAGCYRGEQIDMATAQQLAAMELLKRES